MTLSRRFIALAGLFALTLGPAAAQNTASDAAKDFPSRSIKIVVPFPAGGPSDVLARLIGQKMSEDWGQPVVIENRPGANTVIGAQVVEEARARRLHDADGDRLHADHEPVPLPHAAIRSDQRLRAGHAGRQDHAAPDGQFGERGEDGEGPDRARPRPSPASSTSAPAPSRRGCTGFLFNKAAGVQDRAGALQRQRRGHPGPADQERRFHLRRSLGRGVADPERAVPRAGEVRRPRRSRRRRTRRPSQTRRCPSLDQITVWLGLVAPKGTPPAIVTKLQQEVAKTLADPAIKAKADAAGSSRNQHAGGVRGLHQDRGRPLVEGRGRNRHEVRLIKTSRRRARAGIERLARPSIASKNV